MNAAEIIVNRLLENYGQVTLADLGLDRADEDELIWQFIGRIDLRKPLSVHSIDPKSIRRLKGLEHYRHASSSQRVTVKDYVRLLKAGKLSQNEMTIVVYDGHIIDGHHRAKAAVLAGVPLFYVDLSDLDADGSP